MQLTEKMINNASTYASVLFTNKDKWTNFPSFDGKGQRAVQIGIDRLKKMVESRKNEVVQAIIYSNTPDAQGKKNEIMRWKNGVWV